MNKTVATWLVFIIPLALGLFYIKHVVQGLEEDLATLQKNIDSDKEEAHVLRAEWTYLSRPERVKILASKYLELSPTSGEQIADIGTIPIASGKSAGVMESSYHRADSGNR